MKLHKPAARSASVLLFVGFFVCACDSGTPGPPAAVPVPGTEQGQTTEATASEQTDEAPASATETEQAQPQVPDYQIVTRIRMRYLADQHVRPFTPIIRVSSHAGEVSLTGAVELGIVSVRAEAIARNAYGVVSVDNQIEAPPATEEELVTGAEVPASVMAVEPDFADAVRNYQTNEEISEISVVRRPDPVEQATEVQPDDGAEEQTPEPHSGEAEGNDDVRADSSVGSSEPVSVPDEAVADSDPSIQEGVTADGPVRTYTVQSGDTLWLIAQSEMGAGSRWGELFEANNDRLGGDPDHLRAGMELVIPE